MAVPRASGREHGSCRGFCCRRRLCCGSGGSGSGGSRSPSSFFSSSSTPPHHHPLPPPRTRGLTQRRAGQDRGRHRPHRLRDPRQEGRGRQGQGIAPGAPPPPPPFPPTARPTVCPYKASLQVQPPPPAPAPAPRVKDTPAGPRGAATVAGCVGVRGRGGGGAADPRAAQPLIDELLAAKAKFEALTGARRPASLGRTASHMA